jgi:hypothetical protein
MKFAETQDSMHGDPACITLTLRTPNVGSIVGTGA